MFGYLMQAADVSQGDINVAKLVLIGTIVTTIGAVVIAYIGNRRIGKPNGKGNVVEMNEKQLVALTSLAEQHSQIIGKLAAMDEKQGFIQDLLLNHIATPGAHGGSHERVLSPDDGWH